MSLTEYFESNKGLGVFSTADFDGNVNSAIYARPHFDEDQNAIFIMKDRLNKHNLNSNPRAVYLFKEEEGYEGKRLYLTLINAEQNDDLLAKYRRSPKEYKDGEARFIVTFKVDKVLPLIGS